MSVALDVKLLTNMYIW